MEMLRIVLGVMFSVFSFTASAQFDKPVEKMTLHGFKYQEIAVETKVPFETCFLFSCKQTEITIRGTLWLPANREQSPPYKVAIANHGGHTSEDERTIHYRIDPDNSNLLYEFLRKDYAVLFALRKGFSANELPRSEISPDDSEPISCDAEGGVKSATQDVKAYLKTLTKRNDLDMSKVVLVGYSRGGLISLGLAAESYPGVIGVINLSGGWLSENKTTGEPGCGMGINANFFRQAGAKIKVPVLSVYGSRDSKFSISHIQLLLSYLSVNPSSSYVVVDGARHLVPSITWTAEREEFLKLVDP